MKWIISREKRPWVVLGLITLIFFLKEISYIQVFGAEPLGNADGFSEANSRDGASLFLKEGMLKNAFLPVYPNLNTESPSKEIETSHVYTHYFPGPDYAITFFYEVFGESVSTFQWMRLFPLFHILISVLLFAFACEKGVCREWEWGKVWIAAWLFGAPAMTQWVINLHGHAYTTSYILTLMALGIWSVQDPVDCRKKKWGMRLGAFALGFCSIYMLMTAVFVTAAAPLVGSFLVHDRKNAREAWFLSIAAGLGLVAAFGVHYVQIASVFGWPAAWYDQFGIALVRGGDAKEGKPDRIMLIGQYSHHVWRFFRVSALSMLFSGWFAAWLHQTEKVRKTHLALSVTFATLAGYAWIMTMKKHAIDHPHVNPRIYFVLYAAWIALLASLAADHSLLRKKILRDQSQTE